jgi:hypothetical protein
MPFLSKDKSAKAIGGKSIWDMKRNIVREKYKKIFSVFLWKGIWNLKP